MTDDVIVPREPTREMLKACLDAMKADKFSSPKRIWSAMLAAAPKAEPISDPYKLGEGEVLQWVDGYPEKFRSGEWFIAMTSFGDRVCLKALPEEYSYDFTTADGTYIKAEKIVKWMPFPDSEFRHPAQPEAPKVEQEPVAWRYRSAERPHLGWTKPEYSRRSPHGRVGVDEQPLYTHPAPASDELLEALEEARTTISMLKRNVVNEINNHDGFFRWEGVPDALQARIDAINTTLAKHKGPQS